jgi:hypothetical protein
LAEDSADGGATHIVLGFALGFRGFQDGGGHIHNTGIGPHTLVMHGLTQHIAGDSMDIHIGFQHLTCHIGESELK